MSDTTTLQATISADASELNAELQKAAQNVKASAEKMSKNLDKLEDKLDDVADRADEAASKLNKVKSVSESKTEGGFISKLSQELGMANSSAKDVIQQMFGIGSQADLILKGMAALGEISLYYLNSMKEASREAAEEHVRVADSLKEVSDASQRNRDITDDAMRQLGQLAGTEKLSNIQKQQQIELLAKLSRGYADLADKIVAADGSIQNFDEIMVEKLKRDKARQLQEIDAELASLRAARNAQREIAEDESSTFSLLLNHGDDPVREAMEKEQELANRIRELTKKRAEIAASDKAGEHQRMAEARRKDEQERQREAETSSLSQMSDELKTSGMNPYDRRRFDLEKKLDNMRKDITSDDGLRQLEEYRQRVLTQIQQDEDAERLRLEEGAAKERLRLEENAAKERLRLKEDAERKRLEAEKKVLDASSRLGLLQDRHQEEIQRKAAQERIAALQKEADVLRDGIAKAGFDGERASYLLDESAVGRHRRRRRNRTVSSLNEKIARAEAGERVVFKKSEKRLIREQEAARANLEAKQKQIEAAKEAEAQRQADLARNAAETQLKAAEAELEAARELSSAAQNLAYSLDEERQGVASENSSKEPETTRLAASEVPVATFQPSTLANISSDGINPSLDGLHQQLTAIHGTLQTMATKFYFVQG